MDPILAPKSVVGRQHGLQKLSKKHIKKTIAKVEKSGPPNTGVGSRVTRFWGAGKTSLFEKNIAKREGKHQFLEVPKIRAVREGGLLRG